MKDLRVCAVVVPVCRREGCGVITERPDGWLRARCDDCTSALMTGAFAPLTDSPLSRADFPPSPGTTQRDAGEALTAATGR